MSAPAVPRKYWKQPRVGATIATGRYGVCTVTLVQLRGLKLKVRDINGDVHQISRDPSGWWVSS